MRNVLADYWMPRGHRQGFPKGHLTVLSKRRRQIYSHDWSTMRAHYGKYRLVDATGEEKGPKLFVVETLDSLTEMRRLIAFQMIPRARYIIEGEHDLPAFLQSWTF